MRKMPWADEEYSIASYESLDGARMRKATRRRRRKKRRRRRKRKRRSRRRIRRRRKSRRKRRGGGRTMRKTPGADEEYGIAGNESWNDARMRKTRGTRRQHTCDDVGPIRLHTIAAAARPGQVTLGFLGPF